jgi:hypothetical protein
MKLNIIKYIVIKIKKKIKLLNIKENLQLNKVCQG